MWIHAWIRSWNQPVLSNKGKVSCSRKQRASLMGLEPTTNTLRSFKSIRILHINTITLNFIYAKWEFEKTLNFKTNLFIQSSQITTLQHSIILHIFDTLLFNRELFILSHFSISKLLFRFYYWDEDINIVNKLMIWQLATLVQEQNKAFQQNDCRNVWCILSRKNTLKNNCSSFWLSCI